MSDEKLKPGDVVQLNSGGPWMTVIGKSIKPGYVSTLWFDGDGGRQESAFLSLTLILRKSE